MMYGVVVVLFSTALSSVSLAMLCAAMLGECFGMIGGEDENMLSIPLQIQLLARIEEKEETEVSCVNVISRQSRPYLCANVRIDVALVCTSM